MFAGSRRVFLSGAVVLGLAAAALAAWTPTAKETTNYRNAVTTVRTNLATWTTGVNSGSVKRVTRSLLKAADRHFSRALAKYGTAPGWKQVVRSLGHLKDGVRLLEIAARQDRKVAAFQTFITTSNASLAGQAGKLALSAAAYVTSTYPGQKKATRKLLKAGARTTKAGKLLAGTPPKASRAIKLYLKAISGLGAAGLL